MNRTILISLFILGCSLFLHAQDSCAFETLFTIKAGMSKTDVMDLINKQFDGRLQLVNTQIEKLPPYKGSGGDSIIKEVFSYKPSFAQCFHGRNTLAELEFADNKLYKAYISTEYSKTAYQDMITNYNSLRNVIKAKWPYERGIKLSGGNVVGFGYDYTKTKSAANNKTEKVSLQYVNTAMNNPNSAFVLEVLWANLENTRMEGSKY